MNEWFSEANLMNAWRFVKKDIKDNFAFDVIDYEDVKTNIDFVIQSLESQISSDRYHPSPLLKLGIPKNRYSVRPGTIVNIVDFIVLYAIVQQVTGLLDPILSDSVFAYRLNPKAGKSGQHLFANRQPEAGANEEVAEQKDNRPGEDGSEEDNAFDFPYNWFPNWIQFHLSSKHAAEEFQSVAVTDITAYFENISLDILRSLLKENLPPRDPSQDLIERLFRLFEYWDWTPSGNLPTNIGLPQGNDISSFLANLYLIKLDKEMLEIVGQDSTK